MTIFFVGRIGVFLLATLWLAKDSLSSFLVGGLHVRKGVFQLLVILRWRITRRDPLCYTARDDLVAVCIRRFWRSGSLSAITGIGFTVLHQHYLDGRVQNRGSPSALQYILLDKLAVAVFEIFGLLSFSLRCTLQTRQQTVTLFVFLATIGDAVCGFRDRTPEFDLGTKLANAKSDAVRRDALT